MPGPESYARMAISSGLISATRLPPRLAVDHDVHLRFVRDDGDPAHDARVDAQADERLLELAGSAAGLVEVAHGDVVAQDQAGAVGGDVLEDVPDAILADFFLVVGLFERPQHAPGDVAGREDADQLAVVVDDRQPAHARPGRTRSARARPTRARRSCSTRLDM